MLDGRLVVAHNTAFDLSVLRSSAEHQPLPPGPVSVRLHLPNRSLSECPTRGVAWSLDVLADEFGIPLSHHDPLSDAHAAGLLWLALPSRFVTTHRELLTSHGYRLGHCHLSGYKPFSNASASSSGSFRIKDLIPRGEPDPEGMLYAKRIVITGTLESMVRREGIPTGRGTQALDHLNQSADALTTSSSD